MNFCSNCGTKLEGEEYVCPNCSMVLRVKENNISTPSEAKQGSETVISQPLEASFAQGHETVKPVEEVPLEPEPFHQNTTINQVQYAQEEKKSNLKRNLIILGVVAFIVLLIGLGIKSYKDQQAHEAMAENYNNYLRDFESASDLMSSGAETADKILSGLEDVWANAIYEEDDPLTDDFTKINGVFVEDFNTAIDAYYDDLAVGVRFNSVMDNQEEVETKMKLLKKAPEGLEEHHDKIYELYDLYQEFTDYSLTPTGSLKTFREHYSELKTDFNSMYKKVKRLDNTKMD